MYLTKERSPVSEGRFIAWRVGYWKKWRMLKKTTGSIYTLATTIYIRILREISGIGANCLQIEAGYQSIERLAKLYYMCGLIVAWLWCGIWSEEIA